MSQLFPKSGARHTTYFGKRLNFVQMLSVIIDITENVKWYIKAL